MNEDAKAFGLTFSCIGAKSHDHAMQIKINLRSHTYNSEIIHTTYILKTHTICHAVNVLRSECGGMKCGTQIKIEKLKAFIGVKRTRIRSVKI